MSTDITRKKTITDFGDQWIIHGNIEDDWTSDEKFRDHFGDIFDPKKLENKIVCDVGSGCGRIVKFISQHLPKTIYAVEPSAAGVNAMKINLSSLDNLKILNVNGETFKTDELCDFIISIGVIHHIVARAAIVAIENMFIETVESNVATIATITKISVMKLFLD